MPMAIPMSASFRAGASFTPSPVIATTSPASLRMRTMSCLCLGSARENTQPPVPDRILRRSPAGSARKSRPVKLLSLRSSVSENTPISRQIASAVFLLSPVMTITRIPASLQSLIAPCTSSRGGSCTLPLNYLDKKTPNTKGPKNLQKSCRERGLTLNPTIPTKIRLVSTRL